MPSQVEMFGGAPAPAREGPERVAIVGSRVNDITKPHPDRWYDTSVVRKYINGLPKGTVIVSGGASGIDSLAEEAALERGLVVVVCKPPWRAMGRRAGFVRNGVIVDIADRGVAFWDGHSPGTKSTIELFKKAGKPIEVIILESEKIT